MISKTIVVDLVTVALGMMEVENNSKFGSDGKWVTIPSMKSKSKKDFINMYPEFCVTDIPEDIKISSRVEKTVRLITINTLLDIVVHWAGKAVKANIDGYKGFEMSSGFVGAENVVRTDIREAVRIDTREGTLLTLAMTDKPPTSMFDMVRIIKNLQTSLVFKKDVYGTVLIPTVDIDKKFDVKFAEFINYTKEGKMPWEVVVCNQGFEFIMTDVGASARVNTKMVAKLKGISKEPKIRSLTFDKPFFGWFTSSNSNVPIAMFYAAKDCWK
jgi:hypothetical protein